MYKYCTNLYICTKAYDMATVKFFTRTNLDKLAPVYMRLTDSDGVNIITRTMFKMKPSYWDAKKQRCTDDFTENGQLTPEDARKTEKEFFKLKDHIQQAYNEEKGGVTAEWLTGVISKYFHKDAPKAETLRQYFNRYYDEAKAGTRLATVGTSKRRYAYETLRSLRGTLMSFEMLYTEPRTMDLFQKRGYTAKDLINRNKEIDAVYNECKEQSEKEYNSGMLKVANFNDITTDWYNSFLQFYYKRGCGANYIGKHIKNLKTIMRQAREEGLHNNNEIERKSFKALSEPSDNIYLTKEEVSRMHKLDLSDNPILAKVRDIFLCGVYTAQRYSDYSRINKSMVKEEDGAKYLELIQQKTGEKCMIPISPELDEILIRYDYTLPKSFEQKINDNIKTVGQKCDINESITTEMHRGGKRISKTVPKYKLIKTHTARRTGCSLMYLAGVQPIDIMKVSGHKTEKEFLKYIRVGKKETALNLSKHPYFSGWLRVAQ